MPVYLARAWLCLMMGWIDMSSRRSRKVIGVTMMAIGGGGLALFLLPLLLMLLLFLVDEKPVEAVLLIGALFSLVAMRIWKSTRPMVPPLLLCLAIGYFCYYRWWTAEGCLASYGVSYNPNAEAYESSSLNKIAFWFDGPPGRLVGPEVMGDLLYVERPYRTPAGQVEFKV